MSVECSECEWDARAGHHEECSRHPRHIIPRQRAEIARLTERCDAYREALTRAAAAFRRYAEHHQARGAHDKAATNRALARMCEAALASPAGEQKAVHSACSAAPKAE